MPDKPKVKAKDIVNPFARMPRDETIPPEKPRTPAWYDPRRWMGSYGSQPEPEKAPPVKYEYVIDPVTGKPVSKVKKRR